MNRLHVILLLSWRIMANIIYYEDFQHYTVPGSYLQLPFDSFWHHKSPSPPPPNNYYQIVKSSTAATQGLDMFYSSDLDAPCTTINGLVVGAVYGLSFDSFNDFGSEGALAYAEWDNQKYWADILTDYDSYHTQQTLPQNTLTSGQLCFGGNSSFGVLSSTLIDNITFYVISTPTINNSNSVTIDTTTQLLPASQGALSLIAEQTGQYLSYFVNSMETFGFGYLISNLLDFWNIIILYYLLGLETQPSEYRVQVQKLCLFMLQDGSIVKVFTLITGEAPKFPMIDLDFQKIAEAPDSWPSFKEASISSQVLQNNYQQYLLMVLCLFKLGLFRLLARLPLGKIQKMLKRSNKSHKSIFLFQIVSSTPILVFPAAIMTMRVRQISFKHTIEKYNNMVILIAPILCLTAIIGSFLISYGPSKTIKQYVLKKNQPQIQIGKTIIQTSQKQNNFSINKKLALIKQRSSEELLLALQKQVLHGKNQFPYRPSILTQEGRLNKPPQTAYLQDIHPTIQLDGNIQIPGQKFPHIAQPHKVECYQREVSRQQQFTRCMAKLELLDNLLFLTIPIFIGAGSLQMFFSINLLILMLNICGLFSYRKMFRAHQLLIRVSIKIIWMLTHLSYFVFYLQDLSVINISSSTLQIFGLISLLGILVGALIQFLHTIINFCIFLYQVIRVNCKTTKKNNNQIADKNIVDMPSSIPHLKPQVVRGDLRMETIVQTMANPNPSRKNINLEPDYKILKAIRLRKLQKQQQNVQSLKNNKELGGKLQGLRHIQRRKKFEHNLQGP